MNGRSNIPTIAADAAGGNLTRSAKKDEEADMSIKLGTGNFQYEWVDNWAKLPQGMALGYTHGVVVDAKDNVYIHNQSKDAVIVFDRDGNFIKSWGQSMCMEHTANF